VAPIPAAAEPFYVGGAAGLNLALDWLALGTAGYRLGSAMRTEVEIGYRANYLDDIGASGASGDLSVWSTMLNVAFEFDVGWRATPYVGGGLGAGRVAADATSRTTTTTIDDSDTVFAYQALAGLQWPLRDKIHLDVGYRLFSVVGLDFATSTGSTVDPKYLSHSFMIGLRYLFGSETGARSAVRAPANLASADRGG
jgi:opacity protein-like surface antigen